MYLFTLNTTLYHLGCSLLETLPETIPTINFSSLVQFSISCIEKDYSCALKACMFLTGTTLYHNHCRHHPNIESYHHHNHDLRHILSENRYYEPCSIRLES